MHSAETTLPASTIMQLPPLQASPQPPQLSLSVKRSRQTSALVPVPQHTAPGRVELQLFKSQSGSRQSMRVSPSSSVPLVQSYSVPPSPLGGPASGGPASGCPASGCPASG